MRRRGGTAYGFVSGSSVLGCKGARRVCEGPVGGLLSGAFDVSAAYAEKLGDLRRGSAAGHHFDCGSTGVACAPPATVDPPDAGSGGCGVSESIEARWRGCGCGW